MNLIEYRLSKDQSCCEMEFIGSTQESVNKTWTLKLEGITRFYANTSDDFEYPCFVCDILDVYVEEDMNHIISFGGSELDIEIICRNFEMCEPV